MDYFRIIGLEREPFSNSPDPNLFFESRRHQECLQQIEISIRLRRGLSIVLGDIGTGKTTLCRRLIQTLSDDQEILTYLILDPSYQSAEELLQDLHRIFFKAEAEEKSTWKIKEKIKNFLFQNAAEENKIILLIIDEGQKLSPPCLEVLRELLNYESNEHKLLQIIIFAQQEFGDQIKEIKNFTDRVSQFLNLTPLTFRETIGLVRYRLQLAASGNPAYKNLFTPPALFFLYHATKGYPRKIMHLCHKCILTMIIKNSSRINAAIVRSCVKQSLLSGYNFYTFPNKKHITIALFSVLFFFFIFYQAKNLSLLNSIKEKLTSYSFIVASKHNSKPHQTQVELSTKELQVETKLNPNFSPKITNKQNAISNNSQIPKVLGRIFIKDGDILSGIAEAFYGFKKSKEYQFYLNAIKQANPAIENINLISPGQSIILPAIPTFLKNTPKFCVQVFEANDLNVVYRIYKNRFVQLERYRILPYYDPSNGYHIPIVLNIFFTTKEEAIDELNNISKELKIKPKILCFTEQTAFFTLLN
ncbi:AAA family ATPase [Desulfovulcanus sp.]